MKIKRVLVTALIGCGLLNLGNSGTASANQGGNSCEPTELVLNGSFEEPYLGQGRWQTLQQVEGWDLVFGPAIEVQNNVAGSSQDGEQFVELDSHSSSGIAQDIATVAGQTYQMSFWFSPRPGRSTADNKMAVIWDGQEVARVQANGSSLRDTAWAYHEYELTASSDLTRLELHHVGPRSWHRPPVGARRAVPFLLGHVRPPEEGTARRAPTSKRLASQIEHLADRVIKTSCGKE